MRLHSSAALVRNLYKRMTTCAISTADAKRSGREIAATNPKRGLSSFLKQLWSRRKSLSQVVPKLSGSGRGTVSSSRIDSGKTEPKACPGPYLQQGLPSLRTNFAGLHTAATQPSSGRLKRRGSASPSLTLYNLTFAIANGRSSSVRTSQLYVNLKMHSAHVFGAVTFLRAKPVILMTMRFLVSTAAQFVDALHPKCPRQFIIIAMRRDKGMLGVLAMSGTLEIEEKTFCKLSLREDNLCDTIASKYGASTHIQLDVGAELHFCFAIKGPIKPGGILPFQTEFTSATLFLKGQLADSDAALQNETRLQEAERSQKVRDLDLQTNRFLRHEVSPVSIVIELMLHVSLFGLRFLSSRGKKLDFAIAIGEKRHNRRPCRSRCSTRHRSRYFNGVKVEQRLISKERAMLCERPKLLVFDERDGGELFRR